MYCPICRGQLKVTGQDCIQTLLEHVERPNDEPGLKDIYQCTNTICDAQANGLLWSEGGEFFDYNSKGNHRYSFINKNHGPFGSLERKIRVEIYKKDENFFLLKSKWFDIEVVWRYKADEDGRILRRRPSIAMWKWEGDRLGSKVGWSFPWSTFFYFVKSFYRDSKYKQEKELTNFFYPNGWNKDHFWVKASAAYLKLVHRRIYKKVRA